MSCSGRTVRWLGILLSPLLCSCNTNNLADLKQYVQQVKSRPAETISPLPEVKLHTTFTYQAADLRSPFTPGKIALLRELAVQEAAHKPAIQPEQERPKEPLEKYPLDSLNMVGTLRQGEDIWALIRAPDGILYRVTEGNHVGQHYGKITGIDEEKVELIEIVSKRGVWVERQAMLMLTE